MSLHRRQRAGRSHPRRRLRAAPPPCCTCLDWRGAERAPLAKPGTLPAMEASVMSKSIRTPLRRVPRVTQKSSSNSNSTLRVTTASLHSARRPEAEHGIWGRQEARSSRSERALDGGGSPKRTQVKSLPRVRIPLSPQIKSEPAAPLETRVKLGGGIRTTATDRIQSSHHEPASRRVRTEPPRDSNARSRDAAQRAARELEVSRSAAGGAGEHRRESLSLRSCPLAQSR